MTLRTTTIPNMVQGVSEQAPALRSISQCEVQENGVPSLVLGLQKRPPIEFTAKLSDSSLSSAHIHFANRDATERYIMVPTDGDLQIFDKDTGVAQTVNFPDGKAYLTAADPKGDFKLVTVADYTFLVNRTVTTAMDATLSASNDFQALVAVKQGDYSTRYVIYIDGVEVANHVTSDTVQSETRTDDIATELETDLNAAMAVGFTVVRYGSSLLIEKADGTSFNISTWDSRSDDALKVATDKVQRFTDLPALAPDGYTVEVVGDNTNNFDNYYVTFVAQDTASTVSDGVWEETIAPGIKYILDPATMPHVIISSGGGVFSFEEAVWDDRLVGDANSNPEPSFIGHKINGVSFFQNRLVLLADDNAILSGVGDYFRFWRTTAKELLDDDPIDVAAAYTKVAVLYHAIPYDRKLILFSDQSQWALGGGQILSPKNVSMDLLTTFAASPDATPTSSGSAVFFPTRRGSFTAIQEMEIIPDSERADASNVAEHVPRYIPSGVHSLAASASENVLAAISSSNSGVFHVYNWHWSITDGGRRSRVQSAWHKFSVTGAEILAVEFFDSEAAIIYVLNGKTLLGSLQLDPGRADDNQDFANLLDNRLDETDCTVVYSAVNDETTVTFPVPLTDPVFVGRATEAGDLIYEGTGTGTVWAIPGDRATFHAGSRYTFRYQFSEQVLRKPTATGSLSPVAGGRLQMRWMTLRYSETGYFNVNVTPLFGSTYVYGFSGRVLGQGANLLGSFEMSDGSLRFPIQARADQVIIEIESDGHVPCGFLTAEWEASYTNRTR